MQLKHVHVHKHVTSPPKADPNFLTYFTAKGGHQYLNGQHLACVSAYQNVCDFNEEDFCSYIR